MSNEQNVKSPRLASPRQTPVPQPKPTDAEFKPYEKDGVRIQRYGCTIGGITPPGGHNICLGYDEAKDYYEDPFYLGQTIGQVANRIAGGKLTLGGKTYQLDLNEKNDDGSQNCLHGGDVGWGRQLWEGPLSTVDLRKDGNGVLRECKRFWLDTTHRNVGGFPGNVHTEVFWTIYATDESEVVTEMEYEAHLNSNHVKETVISVTNHSFFNLSEFERGDTANLEGTRVMLATTLYLELDPATNIPTGRIADLADEGPIEAHKDFTMTKDWPKLDHCFVMPDTDPANIRLDTRHHPMRTLAYLYHPTSGMHLKVESTEDAFQFYTGEGLNFKSEKTGITWGPRSGVAIEPGRYTDACSRAEWQHMVKVVRHQQYGGRNRYTSWKTGPLEWGR